MFIDPAHPDRWPTIDSASASTAYEADALTFCRAWLSGQDTFILHTSGSTGTPKAVRLTRAQMKASAHLTGRTLGLNPGDPALVCLNIRYVAGIMMLVRGLELGLPMTIVEPDSNPLKSLRQRSDPEEHSFAFTALVPLQLQTILEDTTPANQSVTRAILNGMKAILVGGAPTSPALEQALQRIGAPIFATYGMTETVSHIALRRLNGPRKSDVFTALAGVELGVDDRSCLHITAAATNFKCVQTNDIVDLLPASAAENQPAHPGHFRVLGRADNVINSGGVKIQPELIERIVQDVLTTAFPADPLPRLFVAGLPDERLGQRLVLISEEHTLTDEQWARVQSAIQTQHGTYWVPKDRIVVQTFTETPSGKVDQKATLAQIA